MYEEYFGLKRSPFRITPDTSLFYDGGQRGDILGALVYAVLRGEGIIKVVGEVGSGKTMLCRMLQLELPETIEIVYIANPSVSPEDILFVIASELNFKVERDATKHELVSMLHHYLLQKHADNKQVVLFVEEAQGMPLETLEEIRLLSNLETDQHKLLQIILFGQPELDENLANNSIRQLRERITHDFNLKPLTDVDVHQYLNFRMREVGYTGPELINKKLAEQMAKYSEGLLRRINILSDKMLLSAFAEGTHTLTKKHLLAAVNDSGFSKLPNTRKTAISKSVWISIVVVLLLIALAYAGMQSQVLSGLVINQPVTDNPIESPVVVAKLAEDKKMTQKIAQTTVTDIQQAQADDTNKPAARQLEQQKKVDLIEKKLSKAKTIDDYSAEAEESIRLKVIDAAEDVKSVGQKVLTESKKNQQSIANLVNLNQVKVEQSPALEKESFSENYADYQQWLDNKIMTSKEWLKNANKQSVSIQVLMRSKSAGKDLVEFLNTDWPLDLKKTYLYEVEMKGKKIYRVFYDEYPSITIGQIKMKQLPESVRVNSPYLHSIYRMQKALL